MTPAIKIEIIRKLILFIILTSILLILVGGEYRTTNEEVKEQCSNYCKEKGMIKYDYTGIQKNYIKCVCQKIILWEDLGVKWLPQLK